MGSTDATAPAWRNPVVLHIQRGSDEEGEPDAAGMCGHAEVSTGPDLADQLTSVSARKVDQERRP